MDPHQRLIDEWKTLEILVAMTCRRRGLNEADADIVATMVMLKLFENDCEIGRRFRGGTSAEFRAYLNRIVVHTFSDFCIHRFGKWHASASAKRLGEAALLLEKLVYREERDVSEAIAAVHAKHPDVSEAQLARMLAQLRGRPRRNSAVSLEASGIDVPQASSADDLIAEHDRRKLEHRTAELIRTFIQGLSDGDRLLLQYTFESNMPVSAIERMVRIPAKKLYRRRDQLLRELRVTMANAGVTAADAECLVGHISETTDFGLRNDQLRPTQFDEEVATPPELSK